MVETAVISNDVNREKMATVFRKRATELADRKSIESRKDKDIPVLVFWIGNERYAIALEDLSSVLPYDKCTPVPKSDKLICGVINIRGELCCVVELSALMGLELPDQDEDEKGYVLILKRTGTGLKVHRVDQILYYREKDRAGFEIEQYEIPAEYGKAIFQQYDILLEYGLSVFQENIILLDTLKIFNHPLLVKKQP